MKIAIGKSRMDSLLIEKDMTWEEFCEKVSKPVKTEETFEEYKKMSKEKQNHIKDVGGFVAGHLKDNIRKKKNVLSRSMLTLDMDYGRKGIWDEISVFCDFTCCIYSTHRHCSENPRYRLIIPLREEVTGEEYEIICRLVAKEIGEELFDKTTYDCSRLMYWPSVSADGEFVFEKMEGKLLDPHVYLKKQEETLLCEYKDEKIKTEKRMKEDPLKKENIVGTFCRTYTMTQSIDKFLPHVYSPSTINGRYDYIPAKSVAGLVIYEDKFAYSHHNSDPACGKLLNAYELVSIHLKKEEGNFALNDEKVKSAYMKETLGKANEEFSEENSWYKDFQLNKKGEIKETLDNLVLIMENDEKLKSIVYSYHSNNLQVNGKLPWTQMREGWSDTDNASLRTYINETYKIYSPAKTRDALLTVATTRAYHPIKDYLDNLPPWDENPRVDNLLIDYLGAEDTPYTKAVIRKTLLAALSRIYRPRG